MKYLPLQHKSDIQDAYVHYREISKELPEVEKLRTLAQIARWGGLVVVAAGFIQSIIGTNRIPDLVGGLCLFAFGAGWAIESDHKKRIERLRAQMLAIEEEMEKLGIIMIRSSGEVSVYAGSIATGNAVMPLHDGAYQ